MKEFTFYAECHVKVVAEDEEQALEQAEEMFDSDVNVDMITLTDERDIPLDEWLAEEIERGINDIK